MTMCTSCIQESHGIPVYNLLGAMHMYTIYNQSECINYCYIQRNCWACWNWPRVSELFSIINTIIQQSLDTQILAKCRHV